MKGNASGGGCGGVPDEVKSTSVVTIGGMAVNIVLAALKTAVGLIAGSQALVADAVHSLSDLVTDLAVLVGVRYWTAPADAGHPYGHGKIQALVTLSIGLALAGVSFGIARSSSLDFLAAIRGEALPVPRSFAFWIAVASVVSKEAVYRWTRAVALRLRSPALEANAWHHRSDAISSIPVAIALALSYFAPSLAWADPAGALVVAVFIFNTAWGIVKPALQELTDAEMSGKSAEVAKVALGVAGVSSCHNVRTRRYGGAFQSDLHVRVSRALTVGEGHALGHEVRDAVRAAGIGVTDAVVHVEPQDVRVVLSLGSNVEPRREYLAKALDAVSRFPSTHLVASSGIEETEPVDVPEEFRGLKFLNQIVIVETALDPHDFSARMHRVEDDLGRVRTVKNGPRTIDIDMIDYGGLVLDTPDLVLPHPRAGERDFVMRPWKELESASGR
ncbi:MAG: 2-amino-4-hydroxy-6-hydroxymethyldihydropteridine diphosphokinase [Kiritimatiellae bacterium]|nr:2-amino-4-hydroxy-6-hydroxymethyldihydropteridine diphosphokinase [Kiritimatiellia bacterium]